MITAAVADSVPASEVCEWQPAQAVKSEAEAVTEQLMEVLKQHISASVTADDFREGPCAPFANKAAYN